MNSYDFIDSNIVSNSEAQFVTLNDLKRLSNDSANINIIENQGIRVFYLPFLEDNFANRNSLQVVNLDGTVDSTQIEDLNGIYLSKSQINSVFTIMFKTTSHTFDVQEAAIPEGWWPWRRCYCEPRRFPDGSISSTGDCLSLIDKGIGACTRTGFFRQECSGKPCQ